MTEGVSWVEWAERVAPGTRFRRRLHAVIDAQVREHNELHAHTVTPPMSPNVTLQSVYIDAVATVHNGHRPQWNHEPLTCGFFRNASTPSRALVSLPLSGPDGPLLPGDAAGQRGCTERNNDAVLDPRYPASLSSVDMIFVPKYPVWVTP